MILFKTVAVYGFVLDSTAGDTFEADEPNWSIFVPGLQFENSWNNSSIYLPGDLVTYGGYSYISLTNSK